MSAPEGLGTFQSAPVAGGAAAEPSPQAWEGLPAMDNEHGISEVGGAQDEYEAFVAAKVAAAPVRGFEPATDMHPSLFPHQRDIVAWACRMGRAAIFASFGLGKSRMQLEVGRQVVAHVDAVGGAVAPCGGRFLIVAPLGVRQEFLRDAAAMGLALRVVRSDAEVEGPGLYLAHYEPVRDGKLDPRAFDGVSLDEASCLRGFGGTKTFREFMATMAGDDRRDMSNRVVGEGVRYRFVATATPSPNEFIELLSYSAFLSVLDVSGAKTRFFQRDSEQADNLTLHPHKEKEFWRWVASWAVFVTKPSDIAPHYDDAGYVLPELEVIWHEIPLAAGAARGGKAGAERAGPGRMAQLKMIPDAAVGVVDAARESRRSMDERIAKLAEIRAAAPGVHRVVWHDLEDERRALEKLMPEAVSVYGAQDLEDRMQAILDFADGRVAELIAKPVMLGSGVNFQRRCHEAVFLSVGYKFNDFIQAVHRIHRFLQSDRVRIHIVYTEAQREIRRALEEKWTRHNELVAQMTALVRAHGLGLANGVYVDPDKLTCERAEASGRDWRMVNNDCVDESARLAENSVGLIVTSIPFSTQYKYSDSYRDFGHTDSNAHFFAQMDFLTPRLLRALAPGRMACIHVKDRIVPGGMTGLGFQTVYPFHADCIAHYTRHGFAYMGMVTVVTDVVRENNQTYRLSWTEQCKDATKMGVGMPEYILLFRKPPTSSEKSYADVPVERAKAEYTLGRWQVDAHAFWRSSGNRWLSIEDMAGLEHHEMFKLFAKYSRENVTDHEAHVALCEALGAQGKLPTDFMLFQPQSHAPDVWTDVARMRTMNMLQAQQDRVMHLCLARGSLVCTERGYRPIEDLDIGELVLTHEGRWRAVTAKACMGTKPVVRASAQGVADLRLTPDHKLWTRVARTSHPRKIARAAAPTWVPAGETLGSYVNLKLPPIEASPHDASTWWIVGRWLADGHYHPRGNLVISCGAHKLDALKERLDARAGMAAKAGENCYQVNVRDPDGALRALLAGFGRGADGKRVPRCALALDAEKAEALLSGYLSGDGHEVKSLARWSATSVSRALLLGLAMVAQRARGVVASVYPGRKGGTYAIEGRTVNTLDEWVLSIPPSNRSAMLLVDGAWKKVRAIEEVGDAEVWDISVDEDASFTAEGCVVKNCPLQFDIVDRLVERFSLKGETVLDPFAGLGTVPHQAAKLGRRGLGIELSPLYFAEALRHLRALDAKRATPTLFDLGALSAGG